MNSRYKDQVVLVTAAAGGIGEATCLAFAREGARLVISDIDATRGALLAERLQAQGTPVRFVPADCTREDEVAQLVQTTVQTFGRLDIAANVVGDAVGDAHGPALHLQSVAGWDGTLAVSLRSTFLCMKHEIQAMLAQQPGGGCIVNVASLAGMLFVPESGAAYSAAKAGVIQLTKFAAVHYAERGIRVNALAPGVTPTAAYDKAGPEVAQALISRMLEGHAIKRPIQPAEQAEALLWLCSPQAGMVTGQVLAVDGGWSAR